jgi:adenylate kinase family enzyme
MTPRRVFVRGTSGAGKTTLARLLAEKLGAEYVEMDAIHHLPNWTERPREETQAIVAEIVEREAWVIDGNYAAVLEPHVTKADMVVWLDYGFLTVFWRVLARTVRRSLRREELWAGNRETFGKAFFSRDSIIWWMVTTFHRRRRQCRQMKRALAGTDTAFVHLTSPLATDIWLAGLPDR